MGKQMARQSAMNSVSGDTRAGFLMRTTRGESSGVAWNASLSLSERRVVELSSEGLTDKEIARELGLSLDTVRTYWKRIRQKTGYATRSQVVAAHVSHSIQGGVAANGAPILSIVMDSLPDAIFAWDNQHRMVSANRAARDLFGLSESRVNGFDWLDRVAGNYTRAVSEMLRGLEGTLKWEGKLAIRRPDGATEIRDIECTWITSEGIGVSVAKPLRTVL